MSWRGRLIFACLWIVSLVIIASLASAEGLQPPVAASGAPATVVTVNREPITQADLDRARSADTGGAVGRVLVDLIDERLLVQRGKNLGYEVSDQQFQMIVENIKKQNQLTSDEQLDAALNESNMTRVQLRANVERAAIALRVLQTEGLPQITDADAERYFNAHLEQFPLQTFALAKSAVIERMKADRTTRDVLVRPYLQSLRQGAALVWTQPDLQQAYEQAIR